MKFRKEQLGVIINSIEFKETKTFVKSKGSFSISEKTKGTCIKNIGVMKKKVDSRSLWNESGHFQDFPYLKYILQQQKHKINKTVQGLCGHLISFMVILALDSLYIAFQIRFLTQE